MHVAFVGLRAHKIVHELLDYGFYYDDYEKIGRTNSIRTDMHTESGRML